jgi:hypothetical protein
MKNIEVESLRKIFDLIIKKLEDEGYKAVEVDTDLYRQIPADKWDSFEEETIVTGSLYDDIACLQLLLKDPDRPCTYVDFDRTASVLRAISQANNPI